MNTRITLPLSWTWLCIYVSVDGDVLTARDVSLTYDLLCLVASILGISGCVYQLYPRRPLAGLHPRQPAKLAGYLRQNYVITWLAVADLFAASGNTRICELL